VPTKALRWAWVNPTTPPEDGGSVGISELSAIEIRSLPLRNQSDYFVSSKLSLSSDLITPRGTAPVKGTVSQCSLFM
jgi:hypothetical protein